AHRRLCPGASPDGGAARLRRRRAAGGFAAFRGGDPQRAGARVGPEPQRDPRGIAEGAAEAGKGRDGQGAGAPRSRHRARPQRGGSLPGVNKAAFPAEAGIHRADDGAAEKWVPAFAGNAVGNWRKMANTLFTIGYEKARLADVVATLRAAGVATLIDVRDRPISRRPGFSKRQLTAAAEEAGMRYLHLQALGTPPEGRLAKRPR